MGRIRMAKQVDAAFFANTGPCFALAPLAHSWRYRLRLQRDSFVRYALSYALNVSNSVFEKGIMRSFFSFSLYAVQCAREISGNVVPIWKTEEVFRKTAGAFTRTSEHSSKSKQQSLKSKEKFTESKQHWRKSKEGFTN